MSVETVQAVPVSPVSAKIHARDVEIVQDKPQDKGGSNVGPMASELLGGALLSCQLSTIVKVAAKRKIQLEPVSIECDLVFEGDLIDHIDVRWELRAPDGVEEEKIETVLRLTDKACTISKALAVPVHVSLVTLHRGPMA